jgi:hypothetical protein
MLERYTSDLAAQSDAADNRDSTIATTTLGVPVGMVVVMGVDGSDGVSLHGSANFNVCVHTQVEVGGETPSDWSQANNPSTRKQGNR